MVSDGIFLVYVTKLVARCFEASGSKRLHCTTLSYLVPIEHSYGCVGDGTVQSNKLHMEEKGDNH